MNDTEEKAIWMSLQGLHERILNLEIHKNRQIDENREIDKVLEMLKENAGMDKQ